jgi:hypothetical protein
MSGNNKIQISEGTVIVELQQEVTFLRNRGLVLSEMLAQADAEVVRLSAALADMEKRANEALIQASQVEGSE